jgi:hypothetical protein
MNVQLVITQQGKKFINPERKIIEKGKEKSYSFFA